MSKFKICLHKFDPVHKIKKLPAVRPKEIPVTSRVEKVIDFKSKTYIDWVVTSYFMYVPILETLQSVISSYNFLIELLK